MIDFFKRKKKTEPKKPVDPQSPQIDLKKLPNEKIDKISESFSKFVAETLNPAVVKIDTVAQTFGKRFVVQYNIVDSEEFDRFVQKNKKKSSKDLRQKK